MIWHCVFVFEYVLVFTGGLTVKIWDLVMVTLLSADNEKIYYLILRLYFEFSADISQRLMITHWQI